MTDWEAIAKAHWEAQPSPHAPGLMNGEVLPAVKLATKAKYGGHASFAEAELFYKEFKNLGMAPQDFEHALDRLAPVSFTYHGRPPSMKEIQDLQAAHPKDIRSYYADLPDQDYPHTTSGQMVSALQAATPHAQQHLGRPPVKYEAAYLVHSKEAPQAYYQRLATTTNGSSVDNAVPDETGGNPRPRSSGAPR